MSSDEVIEYFDSGLLAGAVMPSPAKTNAQRDVDRKTTRRRRTIRFRDADVDAFEAKLFGERK